MASTDKAAFYREALEGRTGPLEGTRVLDLTTAWAGPMAACVLGDLGCDVIHVDLPGTAGGTNFPPNLPGTDISYAHATVNRNKRSITCDLRRPEGVDLLMELVAVTDIVVQNFKPGTLDGWGIGYEQCRAANPAIIYVSLSGYGQYGPRSPLPGYDPAALAYGGWMSLNGTVDGPPNKAPTFLADDLAGLHGAIGALGALHHRRLTGEGQHVDVALLDALMFQSCGQLTLGALAMDQPRRGNEVGTHVPSNNFRCADGGWVYLGVALDGHWQKLAAAVGEPDLATAPGFATNAERVANRQLCNALVGRWCADRTTDELLALTAAIGVVCAPVRTYRDAAADPHLHERDMLIPTTQSDGSVFPVTGPAAKFSRTPTTVRSGAPAVGAHTDEVFGEVGVGADRLARLRADGIV